MMKKIKIYILLWLFGVMIACLPTAIVRAENMPKSADLQAAIWRLSGWLIENENESGWRTLKFTPSKGLPEIELAMAFNEPLNPWPSELIVTFQAEDIGPPRFLTISDQAPFGGPNLKITGATGGASQNLPLEALEIFNNLNQKLEKAHLPLAPFHWQEESLAFEVAKTHILYGARFG
ncbi:MAG: hypothetical protein ACRCTY_05015, partial [Candidatus Adiutrix sp.]